MTPVAKTGLHCGPDLATMTEPGVGLVTPVAKTGLHCGDEPEEDITPWLV